MRIWSGYTKFLRSQCNKERVIDSLYFGLFYRKESNDKDGEENTGTAGNTYACIHDNKKAANFLEFKSITNAENTDAIP